MTLGASNPKIESEIDQLFSSILIEQQKFDKLKPAESEEKKQLLQDKVAKFSKLRGRPLVYPYLSSGRGHGPFTEIIDGSVKYDLIGGIGINLLGHSHPLLIKACLESATVDTLMAGNLMPYEDSLELLDSVVQSVKNSKLKHFWFACSGSFAGDMALKMLWQKTAPKYGVIAFKNCFAGRSIGMQDITDNANFREGMPTFLQVRYAPHFDHKDPKNSLSKTLKALDEIWAKEPDTFSTMVMELVQGEGGFVYGDKEFYQGVFEWAKKKNLYIWSDEVQTFGRTGELFAFQTFALEKYVDIVTVGKALQLCGVFYSEELNPKAGLISGTFQAAIPSLKAGKKVLKYLMEGNFFGQEGKIKKLEQTFLSRLNVLATTSCKDKITYVGGLGTMISFEVGSSSKQDTDKFLNKLFENGIVAY
nr:aminotransferase class III-fold pyridoxal phosphate-dependent enzyme [Bacteriovoracaceae bacterium]